jgi:hypothetical protein
MSVNILLNDNFNTFTFGSAPNEWFYYSLNGPLANAGFVHSGPEGTVIGVMPATLDNTANSAFEHVKWLAFRNKSYTVPTSGYIISEVTMSSKQLGIECNPFPVEYVPNPQSDPRLISGSIANINLQYLITLDTFFSNEVIYALYEILPFNKPSYGGSGPDYASFSSLIPIGTIKDYNNGMVTIGTAVGANCASWLVNGEVRYTTPQLGFYPEPQYVVRNLGGPPVARTISNINFGFGVFTLLDACLPGPSCCRPGLIPLENTTYYNPCAISLTPGQDNEKVPQTFFLPNKSEYRLWGQGAIMSLKNQLIYTM